MELLKLSRFKLHLQALVIEVRELRDREHSAKEQVNILVQKQKQSEEEFAGKLTELQGELALSNEIRQKLGRKVSCLQSDNALLENKQKELKETVNNLLESRENFVKAYEDSTCELKRSIQSRDKKLAVLSEKINAYVSLFDSIEKETLSVKQVLDTVQRLVSKKEGIVAELRCKMDKLSSYETLFVEKISDLELKLRDDEDKLRGKDKKISELDLQLKEANIRNIRRPHIEENALSMKDVVIENLLTENKALQSELWTLGVLLQNIQLAVINMNEEDKRAFSSVMGGEEHTEVKERGTDRSDNRTLSLTEERTEVEDKETNRTSDIESSIRKACEGSTEVKTDSVFQKRDTADKPLQGNNSSNLCVSVDNSRTLVCHQDTENSTTQEETAEDPG